VKYAVSAYSVQHTRMMYLYGGPVPVVQYKS
jgi:hypothetical protein